MTDPEEIKVYVLKLLVARPPVSMASDFAYALDRLRVLLKDEIPPRSLPRRNRAHP